MNHNHCDNLRWSAQFRKGSILNSVINDMVNEAMEHYKSGLLDDLSAFTDVSNFFASPYFYV